VFLRNPQAARLVAIAVGAASAEELISKEGYWTTAITPAGEAPPAFVEPSPE
jgi:hypothetical protein